MIDPCKCHIMNEKVKKRAGAMYCKSQNFHYLKGLRDFIDRLMKNHFTLYQGYVKNANHLAELLLNMVKRYPGTWVHGCGRHAGGRMGCAHPGSVERASVQCVDG